MPKLADRVKESRLTVIGDAAPVNGRKAVLCRCSCGVERVFGERWAENAGLKYHTLYKRVQTGMDLSKILEPTHA